jgi:hypothetical protein
MVSPCPIFGFLENMERKRFSHGFVHGFFGGKAHGA